MACNMWMTDYGPVKVSQSEAECLTRWENVLEFDRVFPDLENVAGDLIASVRKKYDAKMCDILRVAEYKNQRGLR